MIRAVLLVVAILASIAVVITAVGYALPRDHAVSLDAALAEPPASVFAILTDVDAYPTWRSDVTSVDVLTHTPIVKWREHGGNGTITFEMLEKQVPARIVTRIADSSLAFGGSWTYLLTPNGSGTKLTITENGEVYNPVFRFMSRYVFGHTATLERFLEDLERHLKG